MEPQLNFTLTKLRRIFDGFSTESQRNLDGIATECHRDKTVTDSVWIPSGIRQKSVRVLLG